MASVQVIGSGIGTWSLLPSFDGFSRSGMINHRWWITLQMMAQTGGVLYRSCWLLPNSTGGLGRDVLQLQVTGGISLRKGSCEWREGAFAVAWDAGMVGVVWKSGGYDCDEPELGGSGRRWWMCSCGADIPLSSTRHKITMWSKSVMMTTRNATLHHQWKPSLLAKIQFQLSSRDTFSTPVDFETTVKRDRRLVLELLVPLKLKLHL